LAVKHEGIELVVLWQAKLLRTLCGTLDETGGVVVARTGFDFSFQGNVLGWLQGRGRTIAFDRYLKVASGEWLEMKKPTLAPKSYLIEKTNLGHILPVIGQKLLTDIAAEDVSRYQQHRIKEKASPKTVNLEVGTVRAILRKHRLFLERPVLEDLFWLIHDDYPAAQRHLLKYKGAENPTNYWVIPP
jgi:hypothetical protein